MRPRMQDVILGFPVVLALLRGGMALDLTVAQNLDELQSRAFTENLVLETDAVSAVHCAQLCATAPRCALFTVSAVPLPGSSSTSAAPSAPLSCRGHSAVVKAPGPGQVDVPGARVFALIPRVSGERSCQVFDLISRVSNWLNKACDGHTDCGVVNSECFAGRCLCTPGYFYSYTGDSCLATCQKSEQQETYLVYPESRLSFNNIDQSCLRVPTLQECQRSCRDEPACVSLEMIGTAGTCCLNNATALTAPQAWTTNDTRATFYAMSCL